MSYAIAGVGVGVRGWAACMGRGGATVGTHMGKGKLRLTYCLFYWEHHGL